MPKTKSTKKPGRKNLSASNGIGRDYGTTDYEATSAAIDVTPMANRANRQNVIFVIEKIENPIITDSEAKFLSAPLAVLPMQEPDHAPRHGLRVLFAAQSHL